MQSRRDAGGHKTNKRKPQNCSSSTILRLKIMSAQVHNLYSSFVPSTSELMNFSNKFNLRKKSSPTRVLNFGHFSDQMAILGI